MSSEGDTWSFRARGELNQDLTNYRDKVKLSKSDTLRRLAEQGIEAEEGPKLDPKKTTFEYLVNLGSIFTALLIAVAAGYFTGLFGSAAFVMFVVVATIVSNGGAVFLYRSLES